MLRSSRAGVSGDYEVVIGARRVSDCFAWLLYIGMATSDLSMSGARRANSGVTSVRKALGVNLTLTETEIF
jgi:hypothetical protein